MCDRRRRAVRALVFGDGSVTLWHNDAGTFAYALAGGSDLIDLRLPDVVSDDDRTPAVSASLNGDAKSRTTTRVVVTGDTHLGPRRRGPLPAALLAACGQADHILHTGDVMDVALLDELRALAPLDGVAGNCDGWDVAALLPQSQTVEIDGVRIALVHDSGPPQGRRARMRERFPDVRAVCFGHSHQPVCDDCDGLLLLNPGSPTERRRAPWHSYAELWIGEGAAIGARIIRL